MITPGVEQSIGGQEQGLWPLSTKCCEGGINVAFGAGIHDAELLPKFLRRFANVRQVPPGVRIGRVYKNGNYGGLGHEFAQQL